MIRRVVTGERDGRSVLVSDGEPGRTHHFQHLPGMGYSLAWATPARLLVGAQTEAEPITWDTTTIPLEGESRLTFLRLPPAGPPPPDFDPAAAGAEMQAHQPDMAAIMEPDGFHRTDSVDYGIVLEGEVDLELDDGATVHLDAHDVVVQGGGRHAWRNRGTTPALLAFVLLGCARQPL